VPGFVALIPARLASTRLPGKPLADLAGVPMVVRVARQAAASGADRVVVCADDASVQTACTQHAVESILTDPNHPTGTDRLSEAAQKLGLEPSSVVVNVQADEPLIEPAAVRAVAELLQARPDCDIATAAHSLTSRREMFDPNIVKVVTSADGLALLFSRAPIPWSRQHFAPLAGAIADRGDTEAWPQDLPALRHVGLYAYRTRFLQHYRKLEPAPIELAESLEQLRALWHGSRIAVLRMQAPLPPGVDTPEDLARVRALLASDFAQKVPGKLPG